MDCSYCGKGVSENPKDREYVFFGMNLMCTVCFENGSFTNDPLSSSVSDEDEPNLQEG